MCLCWLAGRIGDGDGHGSLCASLCAGLWRDGAVCMGESLICALYRGYEHVSILVQGMCLCPKVCTGECEAFCVGICVCRALCV